MKFDNFLIVASKKDPAGINITTQLSQFKSDKFKFYLVEEDMLHNENLDLNKINGFDFVIFASKHQSQKKEKTLSIHPPGNPKISADFGGDAKKVCKTSSQFFKFIFNKLNSNAKDSGIDKDYKVTMEATHHGPLIDVPCLFVEVGATETEWKDRRAGFILAKTINEAINEFNPNQYNENVVAIGGPHYCPGFNKIQSDSNLAISHIIAEYNLPIDADIIKEVLEKTVEEVDFVLLDWKGLGKSEQKNEIIKMLDSLYIRYKKTSEIKR